MLDIENNKVINSIPISPNLIKLNKNKHKNKNLVDKNYLLNKKIWKISEKLPLTVFETRRKTF
jgi:hypothetical protein